MKKFFVFSLFYIYILTSCQEREKQWDGVVVLKEKTISFSIDTQSNLLKFGDFYIGMPENEYDKIVSKNIKFVGDYLKEPNSLKKPLFLWGFDLGNNKVLSYLPVTEMDSTRHLYSYSMVFSISKNNTFFDKSDSKDEKKLKLKQLLADIITKHTNTTPFLYNNGLVWCYSNCFIRTEEGMGDLVAIDIINDKNKQYCNYIKSSKREIDKFYHIDSLTKAFQNETH